MCVDRVLVLEDDPERAQAFTGRFPNAVIVASAPDCIEQLPHEWGRIFLDHDLGGATMPGSNHEDCGYEVVRHLVEHQPEHLRRTRFVVHSANPVGAGRMVDDLQRAGYDAEHIPFVSLLPELQAEADH